MKKLTLMTALILALVAFVVTPATADVVEADAALVTSETSTLESSLEVLEMIGYETPDWMTTNLGFPKPLCAPILYNCSGLNSAYCSYQCNVDCCDPVYIAPGAYCPRVCI